MGKNNLILIVIVAAVVGGLGFFGGMQYQKSQGGFGGNRGPGQFQNGQFPSGGVGGAPSGMRQGGGQPVSGEITSIDNETLTVKAQDGSSKIVIYSGSTTVNKTSSGSVSDLQVGEKVTVIGSQDSNGAITAQAISVGSNMLQRPPEQ